MFKELDYLTQINIINYLYNNIGKGNISFDNVYHSVYLLINDANVNIYKVILNLSDLGMFKIIYIGLDDGYCILNKKNIINKRRKLKLKNVFHETDDL